MQRAITDFGAEHAFGKVQEKIKEHYGIDLPDSSSRTITLKHAEAIHAQQSSVLGEQKGSACTSIVSETDGSMVPVVSIDANQVDHRKGKTPHYREARLSLAHAKDSKDLVFSGTMGDPNEAGKHLAHCVERVGKDKHTHLHCVGDGAPWISDQVEKRFGNQASYLIDFYHVCEYLGAAAPICSASNPEAWLHEQKQLLKENQVAQVLNHLRPYLEKSWVPSNDAPVRSCYRYLANRRHQLDYKTAIASELPIGSGEIESAHRYIIQKRLKIQGAWWLEAHAEHMIALSTHRANGDWEGYWQTCA